MPRLIMKRAMLLGGVLLIGLTGTASANPREPILTGAEARAAIVELGQGEEIQTPTEIHHCWRIGPTHIRCDVTYRLLVFYERVTEETGEVLEPKRLVGEEPLEVLADVGLKGVVLTEFP